MADSDPAYAANSKALWRLFLLLSFVTPAFFKPIAFVFVRRC